MRIGFSSYSLDGEIRAGRMTLRDVIEWSARQGAECMELVPFAFRFDDPDSGKIDNAAIAAVRRQAADAGIPLVNYSVLADFCREGEALEKEIARVKHEIDIAAALGVPRMRHDVAGFRRPQNSNTPADFDRWLPVMAEAARETARYGKALGVTVLIGQNDTDGEYLTLDDAQQINTFAMQANLGRVSMWSLNRDQQCGENASVTSTQTACSGVKQTKGEFATILGSGFRGTPGTLVDMNTTWEQNGSAYPQWNETTQYSKGDKVVWDSKIYEALSPNIGVKPDSTAEGVDSPWRLIGPTS